MKILATAVLAAAAIAVPVGSAMAAPNYLGPSGYMLTPDASVTPNMCFNAGYHYISDNNSRRTLVPGFSPIHSFAGNLGIGNFLEIGGSHLLFSNAQALDTTWLNAKASVLGPNSPFQLAGGVMDALDDFARAAYVVGSFNIGEKVSVPLLPKSLRLGAGWGTANVIDGIFVNGGFLIGKVAEIHGEWIDNTGLVNLGTRWRIPKAYGLALDAGVFDVTNNPTPGGGLSYTVCFGKKRHKKHDEEDDGKGEMKGEPKPAPAGEAKPLSLGFPSGFSSLASAVR
jgi:hypothetical protein